MDHKRLARPASLPSDWAGQYEFCPKLRGRGKENQERELIRKRLAGGMEPQKKNGTNAHAADRAQNLQDTFLNNVRKNKTPLTIFLVNGVKLQGVVTWFDNFCVLLRRGGDSQLVFKHAI